MQLSTLVRNIAFWTLLSSAACTDDNGFPNAGEFSNVIVFGDSLSDNGNLASYLENQIPDYPERASNGMVAMEYVAKRFGFELKPSLYLTAFDPSGTNYAVQGARCIDLDEPPINSLETPYMRIPYQVDTYLASVSDSAGITRADPDALYVIYGGGNDVLDAIRMTQAGASLDDANEYLSRAAASCSNSARDLIEAGARYVVQVDVPDVGDAPRFTLIGDDSVKEVAADLTATFNTFMDEEIATVRKETRIDVVTGDMSSLAEDAEIAGLQLSEPCTISPFMSGVPEADPPLEPGMVPFSTCDFPDADGFAFYDEIHPTTEAHKVASRQIFRSLRKAVRWNKDFPYILSGC